MLRAHVLPEHGLQLQAINGVIDDCTQVRFARKLLKAGESSDYPLKYRHGSWYNLSGEMESCVLVDVGLVSV